MRHNAILVTVCHTVCSIHLKMYVVNFYVLFFVLNFYSRYNDDDNDVQWFNVYLKADWKPA